ncbi:tropomyosin [Ornithinimicrobium faecis]|uniref:tropomyosin n=1 Tax=Ornithinimicrobium faecis TaxID=2934158 RepID=UPI002119048C|nr:tropomyosin [Ornithinimicrobium sp. HY1745]
MTPTDDKPGAGGDNAQQSHDLVREAAAQLYAGALSDFIPLRTNMVKTAKADGQKDAAKEIGTLRKPSVAAWALNQLVHNGATVIKRLADLGARLRRATAQLDAPAIAALRGERDTVLADLVAAAAEASIESGQKLSSAVESEVRNTGIAALADEAAETVLTSGTLTRALSYSGFGEVDLSEAAATTSTGVVLTSIRGGRAAGQAAGPDDTAGEEADEIDDDGTHEDETEDDDGTHEEETADDGAEAETPDDGAEEGAAALAEAAAAAEHEQRLAQAEEALATAEREIGRRRSAVDAARNRTEATRQRIQKLKDQLERAQSDDDEALEKLTEAVSAAKQAATDLETAREHLSSLQDQGHEQK